VCGTLEPPIALCYHVCIAITNEPRMPTTLRERVEILEQQVQALADAQPAADRSKDWRRTFGASAADADFDEMIALGRAVRVADKPVKAPKAKPHARASS
jgi:hypothetical protein